MSKKKIGLVRTLLKAWAQYKDEEDRSEYADVCAKETESKSIYSDTGVNFQIYPADGGFVIQYRGSPSRKTINNSTYSISSSNYTESSWELMVVKTLDEIPDSIEKILVLNALTN